MVIPGSLITPDPQIEPLVDSRNCGSRNGGGQEKSDDVVHGECNFESYCNRNKLDDWRDKDDVLCGAKLCSLIVVFHGPEVEVMTSRQEPFCHARDEAFFFLPRPPFFYSGPILLVKFIIIAAAPQWGLLRTPNEPSSNTPILPAVLLGHATVKFQICHATYSIDT